MIIIGVDFHPEFQQIAWVDTETGELQERRLQHREEGESFYRELAGRAVPVRVGMEASGHARWFERLMSELQFELWIGDAAEIRTKRVRKQKTDRQDAQLILRLMLKDDFPRIWVPSWENRDLRQLLWHRHRGGRQGAHKLKRAPSRQRLELFVAEYLTDLNATRAAIAVGYSPKTAGQQGSRLLKNVKVVAEIAAKTKTRIARLEISADNVLQELAKLAFFDPRKLFNPDGSPKHITELDDDTAAGLASLEVQELFEGSGEQKYCCGLVKKIRLADKGMNLERLGKYLNLF